MCKNLDALYKANFLLSISFCNQITQLCYIISSFIMIFFELATNDKIIVLP
jgi:hypothetical protein